MTDQNKYCDQNNAGAMLGPQQAAAQNMGAGQSDQLRGLANAIAKDPSRLESSINELQRLRQLNTDNERALERMLNDLEGPVPQGTEVACDSPEPTSKLDQLASLCGNLNTQADYMQTLLNRLRMLT